VCDPRGDDETVPRARLDRDPLVAAELHEDGSAAYAERLVRAGVVMVEGVHAVAPGGRPEVLAEEPLEALREIPPRVLERSGAHQSVSSIRLSPDR